MEFTILPLLCGQRMATAEIYQAVFLRRLSRQNELIIKLHLSFANITQVHYFLAEKQCSECLHDIRENAYLCNRNRETTVANAEIAQLVEHNLAKVRVASSSLVFRSSLKCWNYLLPRWRNW